MHRQMSEGYTSLILFSGGDEIMGRLPFSAPYISVLFGNVQRTFIIFIIRNTMKTDFFSLFHLAFFPFQKKMSTTTNDRKGVGISAEVKKKFII